MSAESLWVLLGNRHGDNRQLLAIADALGRPYRIVQLRFGPGARLAPARWFAHRLTWRTDPPLAPPWPRAVLAAGRKSVPAALWIRRASGGQTRLIHVNRPWAPLAWFDLVVTTPQYALPERDNVLVNLLPFVPAGGAGAVAGIARGSRAGAAAAVDGGAGRRQQPAVRARRSDRDRGSRRPSTPSFAASAAAPGCSTARAPRPRRWRRWSAGSRRRRRSCAGAATRTAMPRCSASPTASSSPPTAPRC